MFNELNKYKQKGHFFFKHDDNLSAVCNAPKDCSGIYLIYALEKGNVNLIYIGISGRTGKDGNIIHRKDGLRGRFLTGKQFGGLRKTTWPVKIKLDDIEALDIYWFVTHGSQNKDLPRYLEIALLKKFHSINGCFPRWNKGL
ncbi:MAG: hypothetical protein LH619_07565 [Chitinophagaceae bacterium]|nr:hypothetical protein [Chitinophagaceae bacterium]